MVTQVRCAERSFLQCWVNHAVAVTGWRVVRRGVDAGCLFGGIDRRRQRCACCRLSKCGAARCLSARAGPRARGAIDATACARRVAELYRFGALARRPIPCGQRPARRYRAACGPRAAGATDVGCCGTGTLSRGCHRVGDAQWAAYRRGSPGTGAGRAARRSAGRGWPAVLSGADRRLVRMALPRPGIAGAEAVRRVGIFPPIHSGASRRSGNPIQRRARPPC